MALLSPQAKDFHSVMRKKPAKDQTEERSSMKIGLRIPGRARDLAFPDFCNWCASAGFQAIDVGRVTPDVVQAIEGAGLSIGTADLPGMGDLLSTDPAKQEAGTQAACEAIRQAAEHGVRTMFFVIVPPDAKEGRAANFERWKAAFPPVLRCAEEQNVRLALEGWPGGPPHYPSLGCTPEMWRAMFAAFPSQNFGLNYDPSHLVRIGVDYLRALVEFGGRIFHAHGKDTEIDQEALYLHGNLGPTFTKPRAFGEDWWRYCIPGDGLVDWAKVVARLSEAGFDGIVSVELEDARYHQTWALESEGLVRSRNHLAQFVR
jgi:sugar phosphate isomerase/epimerase